MRKLHFWRWRDTYSRRRAYVYVLNGQYALLERRAPRMTPCEHVKNSHKIRPARRGNSAKK